MAITTPPLPRALILAPPSLAAHPALLAAAALPLAHNRDIQMLDRLAAGILTLPPATYDVVLLATDPSTASPPNLPRPVVEQIAAAIAPGGKLRLQSGAWHPKTHAEVVLAGLVPGPDALVLRKPVGGQSVQTVSLRKREDKGVRANGNGHTTAVVAPIGVGWVDSYDDFDGGLDDGTAYGLDDDDVQIPSTAELEAADTIDPDSLLTEDDRRKPLDIPDACKPNSKRRRACKDCSCGLAQRLQAEDHATRSAADARLAAVTLDPTEVDFTVQGRVGSCGNCALGDAFRCDGCPYVGLPAFQPGEEVRLLKNEVQL